MNIWRAYKDYDFQAIGIEIWDGTPEQVEQHYRQRYDITYPLILNGSSIAADKYGANVDDYFVIDQAGVVVFSTTIHQGPNSGEAAVRIAIEQALGITDVAVDGAEANPSSFRLGPGYPNPFTAGGARGGSMNLFFDSPARLGEGIVIDIMDILGRRVARLYGDTPAPGRHRITWNGRNESGSPVAGGVYFIVLRTPDGLMAQRVAVIR